MTSSSTEEAGAAVLVTRPEPGATQTAARLVALGMVPVVAPLLEILPVTMPGLPKAASLQAVLVTSGHALAPLADDYRDVPLFVVGDATAKKAERLGFTAIVSAGGDAADLAALVQSHCVRHATPLLLATGLGQGEGLSISLSRCGFSVIHQTVYEARPVEELPMLAISFLSSAKGGWITFFSGATAVCFRRLLAPDNEAVKRFRLAAISASVAAVVEDLPWASIHVAMTPTETAVLSLLHE
jgi:uroporphyrinogen-III synthase